MGRRQVLPGRLKSQAAQSSSVTIADGCSLRGHCFHLRNLHPERFCVTICENVCVITFRH